MEQLRQTQERESKLKEKLNQSIRKQRSLEEQVANLAGRNGKMATKNRAMGKESAQNVGLYADEHYENTKLKTRISELEKGGRYLLEKNAELQKDLATAWT